MFLDAPRSRIAVACAATALLMLSACDSRPLVLGQDGEARPTSLIPSPAYALANADADPAARIVNLQRGIDRLRDTTSSGWVGRQDDVTGFLGDLSGGKYVVAGAQTAGTALTAFMADYGPELFGIDGTDLQIDDISNTTSARASQAINEIPVVDSDLVVALNSAGNLSSIRGRVFPDLDVSTTPTLTAKKATKIAVRLSDGIVTSEPELTILPNDTGVLTWRVPVFAATDDESGLQLADGDYYIDANTGDVLEIRATNGSLAAPSAYSFGSQGAPVDVTGTNEVLGDVTAHGLRTSDGYALIDTTTPTFDDSTGDGGIYTLDAQGRPDASSLDQVYVSRSTRIEDGEALGAHFASRLVYDYYAALGRESLDGKNGRIRSIVNLGDDNYCNAYFVPHLDAMLYGNPCDLGNGPIPIVSLEVVGHELTHGVTRHTAGLAYSGQSGSLNESFSDYFGNVIADQYRGTDSNTVGEESCTRIRSENPLCMRTSSGDLGARDMLNGASMNDYVALIALPNRYVELLRDFTDHGGVHMNSAIWNNALWTIRSRLAQIGGEPMVDSDLAHDFDKIVYYTLTHKLVATSGMADAAAAINETIRESGADPVVARVASEVFEQNALCAGCYDPGTVTGEIVASTSISEQQPVIYDDGRILWLEDIEGFGSVAGDGPRPTSPRISAIAPAGTGVLSIDASGPTGVQVVFTSASGTSQSLEVMGAANYLAGIAGSDAGAVFMAKNMNALIFVDDGGNVLESNVEALGGELVSAVATGGGKVAVGGNRGTIATGSPGSELKPIGKLPSKVINVAIHGDKIIALDDANHALAFDLDTGTATSFSQRAMPLGAAINDEYAVFPIANGRLPGRVNELTGGRGDQIDLVVYSFATAKIYPVATNRGQEAFPALSPSGTLVWQDGTFGGDSILKVQLPSGL